MEELLMDGMRGVLKIALLMGLLGCGTSAALAQRSFPQPKTFAENGGEAIYMGVCRDCHMSGANGAVGAGMYPALARNNKLTAAGYPVAVVVNGQKAMPEFGSMLSDQQIADVVNYVRTHFGNHYKDTVTPADVKAARS